jgi:carboxypeptidase family protein
MPNNRTLYTALASFLLGLALAPVSVAQVDSASLTGLVTDPSAASVRGATVTATNRANGVERSTVTDDSGYYNFPSLPVGSYAITVKQNGFTSQVQAVSLDPSAKARLDFHLVVGATTSTVDVRAESP